MRNRFRGSLALAAVGAVLWIAADANRRSGPGRRAVSSLSSAARRGRTPDLNGIWQALVSANWDLLDHEAQAGPHPEITGAYGAGPAGQSIVEGNEIPYQPWAAAKKKENFAKRAMADVSDDEKWHELGDPEFKCYSTGCPAGDLHRPSISDRAGHEPVHPDGVRIHERDAGQSA